MLGQIWRPKDEEVSFTLPVGVLDAAIIYASWICFPCESDFFVEAFVLKCLCTWDRRMLEGDEDILLRAAVFNNLRDI